MFPRIDPKKPVTPPAWWSQEEYEDEDE